MLAETLPWLWTSLEFLLAGDWPEEEEAYQVCTLVHVWGLHWVIHSCLTHIFEKLIVLKYDNDF